MRIPLTVVAVSICTFFSAPAAAQDKLINEGDEWRYFKGTEEPPADWKSVGFDDSQWLVGGTPIGYGPDLPFKTTLADMQGDAGYLAFYLRKKITVSDPSEVEALVLGIKYDDGLIAYLNGEEVVRKNMNAGEPTKDTPGLDHETNVAFEANTLACESLVSLDAGENVLAVEVHNVSLTSSDCSFSAELEGRTKESVCPSGFTCLLRPTGQVLLRWTKPVGFPYASLQILRNGVVLDPGPVITATSFTDRTPLAGENKYKLVAATCGGQCPEAPECSVTVGGGEPMFRRGDVDENGSLGINDAVLVLNSLFRDAGPFKCPDAADADDNGSAQLTDAVFILRYLFQGGAELPPPLTACGTDPTVDDLPACVQAGC